MPTVEQERLVSMLEYLEQWDKLNRSATFDVASLQGGFVAWQAELEILPGVHLNIADPLSEVWMEIERLRPVKPPAPPAPLVPWIFIKDDPSLEPTHRDELPNPEKPEQPLVFEEILGLSSLLKTYVEGAWRTWSETEKPRRKSIATYDKLFNLLQTIETEGAETALELVWGIGVAVWLKNSKRVRYPLVSRLVEIDPITTDMALRIRPRGVPPILETDIYAELENPGLPTFERAARVILDHPEADIRPFDEASYEQLLAGAAGTLDRQARYWPHENDFESGQVPAPTEVLTVTNTWVVFARRKGTNFLIDDIRRLRAAVEREPLLTDAPMVLVQTPEGPVPDREPCLWRGLSSTGFSSENNRDAVSGTESDAKVRELYFPKPFNSEQVQIIDRLEHSSGVVVQGPPGTGKTHTIANVICHYLAEGKRVLVTSKGESALAVLRQQLPAPVQCLTVSLLTSEREGLKQLEQSVSKITSEITTLNKTAVRRDIDSGSQSIDQIHAKIAEIDRELGDWARRNIDPVPPSLDGFHPTALAQNVLEGQQAYSWFPDRLDGRPGHEIPIGVDEMKLLRSARKRVGADLTYLGASLPSLDVLPNIQQISDLHRALLDLDTVSGTIDEKRVPRFREISAMLLDSAQKVRDLLREAAHVRLSLSDEWVNWLRQQQEARHNAQPVFAVIIQMSVELTSLVDMRRKFIGIAIEWEDEWDGDDELWAGIRNAADGKSAFGINPFGKKIARGRYQRLRLNGHSPQKTDDWQWIYAYHTLRRQTRTISCRWNSLAGECPAPRLPDSPLDALRCTESLLAQISETRRWVDEISPTVAGNVQAIFADQNVEGIADDPERMNALADAIEIRLRRHRLEAVRVERNRIRDIFSANSLPVFKQGTAFFDHILGNTKYDSLVVENGWQTILDEIKRLHSFAPLFETIRNLSNSIEKAGALSWAAHLRLEPDVEGSTDWTPHDWAFAWKWSRQFGYLEAIDGRKQVQALASKRLNLQNDLSHAYALLVENLTWLKLRETLDLDRGLMSSLQQYMAAIRGIGAGTGVRAVRFRRDAQCAMKKANRAIRCWIMPHWRVSESLPSELALFDLVIIDEASQSDLWALPALLRAKKLLIVGDNKQVSPSAVGVRELDIRQLYTRFLQTLPFGAELSPDKSIYDLGSVIFASDLVRLREHFRCVEPIISFSNHEFYMNEIRCLRVATAEERFVPPLVDVFVRDGVRDARSVKINRAEARAIVDEIKILTSNPKFSGRSIGVVSLLGNDQPRFIFDLLVQELGEEKIVKHKIRCGDAMTFQGREADIVFISMVSDAQTVRALSGVMYEQRFNVAVSRAKDRLYLYRSFRREDLRENDLRARLLDHFAAPLHRDPEMKGRERCESDFERNVFDRLNAAGYRITPQVKAGTYRIDMVVEGHSGRRLAIECDGDQYHTPKVWMEDLHRQRTLERAGWTFWRCWGSSFIRDPESCMTDLFGNLERLGIEPVGGDDVDLSDIVEYREVGIVLDTAESPASSPAFEDGFIENPTAAPVLSTATRQTPHSQFIQQDLLTATNAYPLTNRANNRAQAEVGDSIRYCFIDNPDDEIFVTIVDTESNPILGMINLNTAIANALLGMEVEHERVVQLPDKHRTIRVLELHKHSRREGPGDIIIDEFDSDERPIARDTSRRSGLLMIKGQTYEYRNYKEAMLTVLREIATSDHSFLSRLAAHPDAQGRTRRYIARTTSELYPDRPDLRVHHEQLPGGWVVATNLNNKLKDSIIHLAVRISGLTFGKDIVLDEYHKLGSCLPMDLTQL